MLIPSTFYQRISAEIMLTSSEDLSGAPGWFENKQNGASQGAILWKIGFIYDLSRYIDRWTLVITLKAIIKVKLQGSELRPFCHLKTEKVS